MEVDAELLASQLDLPCSILQNPGETGILLVLLLPPVAPLDYCLLHLTGPVMFSSKYSPIETCLIAITTLATALERKMTTLT